MKPRAAGGLKAKVINSFPQDAHRSAFGYIIANNFLIARKNYNFIKLK